MNYKFRGRNRSICKRKKDPGASMALLLNIEKSHGITHGGDETIVDPIGYASAMYDLMAFGMRDDLNNIDDAIAFLERAIHMLNGGTGRAYKQETTSYIKAAIEELDPLRRTVDQKGD